MKQGLRYLGAGVALFYVLMYLFPLNSRALWQPDESRYAEISREMLQRGDWIVPHLLGLRYFEKPIAGYWFNTISQWLLGDSNFAVRFAVALSSGISALLVAMLAMMMWRQRAAALLAALIYLSMALVFGVGTYNVLDPMITLWMNAAMVCYFLTLRAEGAASRAGAYLLLGLACGMGVLTKGFLALAVPVLSVLPVAIYRRRFRQLLCYGPLAVVAAVLLCLPWGLAIARREPDFWHYFFWIEHIQRFAENDAQHKAPFWYYLPMLAAGVLPWLGFLPGALWKGWRERASRPELFFLLSWVLMPLLFFSLAKGKLLTYILPCMAPLALLMAAYVRDGFATGRMKAFRANMLINILFGAIGMVALAGMGFGLISDHLFSHHALYNRDEWPKIITGLVIFAGWIAFAVYAAGRNGQRWPWTAACPLLLGLLIGFAWPQHIINNKQPQQFILANSDLLDHSGYILSNSIGVATSLAWELQRSDIIIYRDKGELKYGLSYPDAQGHFVSGDDFPGWLAQARHRSDVTLVLRLNRSTSLTRSLPAADAVRQMDSLILFYYRRRP
ncbi:lipid IV(A) 4-amino-4-deoxy-L-arabinosyltransferase [Martelella alba]|nr:lipid IV(A) 4-amino-4-deoxy-L-arabinosyltransferase [Martelella alba]